MPDFVAVITNNVGAVAPSVECDSALRWESFAWGWLGLAEGLWRRVGEAVDGDALYLSGRACHRGGGQLTSDDLDALTSGDTSAYENTSGMFLALRIGTDGPTLVTDRMSHMPAYAGRDASRVVVASGVEKACAVLDPAPSLDEVSLAELLLWDNITFPHTTREGVQQLAPGSLHTFRQGKLIPEAQTLWRPVEPEKRPSKHECIDAASRALEESADEIASTASRVAVQLSGGIDSRIVLSALAEKTEVEALTFLDEPNRESEAAERTARTLGVKHHLIHRDPEFYERAFREGQHLVGFEQNTIPCHSLCLEEIAEHGNFDAVVGGFGCDILLKGAYVPYSMTDALRAHYLGARLSPDARIGKHNYSQFENRRPLVRPELIDAALARRAGYESAIREFRPRSAEEWIGFYPISHTTSVDSMAADRRLNHDEFFFRAGFVETGAMTPWIWKKGLDLVSTLGKRYAPEVASQTHPSTGFPATWTYLRARLARKLLKRNTAQPREFSKPWFNDSSFIAYAEYFKRSDAWRRTRESSLEDEGALDTLAALLTADPRPIAREYAPDHGSLHHAMLIQALRLITKVQSREGLRHG